MISSEQSDKSDDVSGRNRPRRIFDATHNTAQSSVFSMENRKLAYRPKVKRSRKLGGTRDKQEIVAT